MVNRAVPLSHSRRTNTLSGINSGYMAYQTEQNRYGERKKNSRGLKHTKHGVLHFHYFYAVLEKID